jgi:hypothetical protein
LLRLIKQIIAGRDSTVSPLVSPGDVVETSSAVFEEVSESIELPKFDPEAARARAQASIAQIPDVVIEELREYVSMIACRYRYVGRGILPAYYPLEQTYPECAFSGTIHSTISRMPITCPCLLTSS